MSASEELMACGDFMILLRAVLTLGNHLNEGTMRGSASGADTTQQRCKSCQSQPSSGMHTMLPQRLLLGHFSQQERVCMYVAHMCATSRASDVLAQIQTGPRPLHL